MTDTSETELRREQQYVAGLYARLDALRSETAAELERTRRGGATGTHQARSERDAMARLFEDRIRQLDDVDERLAFGRLQTDDGRAPLHRPHRPPRRRPAAAAARLARTAGERVLPGDRRDAARHQGRAAT